MAAASLSRRQLAKLCSGCPAGSFLQPRPPASQHTPLHCRARPLLPRLPSSLSAFRRDWD